MDTGSSHEPWGNIYHDGIEQTIATNSKHEGVSVEIDGQELVFDNINRDGVTRQNWFKNLYSPIIDAGKKFIIEEIPF
ncbi:papain fold toxin domain-containing protein [Cylindrospermum stagnale]|uniref:papain fold toxin domain-containing protein n=1 Tax=Cylindrospermum stagnale TaxID=142864 RepID=UPI000A2F509C